MSVAKIMGQKPSFWPISKLFRKGIICPKRAKLWLAITQQQIELESYSNPVMTCGVV